MKDVTFGQYYPAKSFVHKLDARVKILLTICLVGIKEINIFGAMISGAVSYIVIFCINYGKIKKEIDVSLNDILYEITYLTKEINYE